jgi:mono/diheme cytochrome c family protein
MVGFAVVLVVETSLLVWPVIQRRWLGQPQTPAERGYGVAERMGCFTCHGPLGKSGIVNPGAPEGEVPAWDGGNHMMYVASPEEIREWILYGAPKRKLDDPFHQKQVAESRVRMPAYEGFLSEGELDDLIAFYKTVAWADSPPTEPSAGRRTALKFGCFSCHGEEGRARQPNPGSFKGYIASWQGDDFAELVRDDNELRTWIMDGGIPRLLTNPGARLFIERQRIQMPAYKDILTESQLDQIVTYIKWLRAENGNQDKVSLNLGIEGLNPNSRVRPT